MKTKTIIACGVLLVCGVGIGVWKYRLDQFNDAMREANEEHAQAVAEIYRVAAENRERILAEEARDKDMAAYKQKIELMAAGENGYSAAQDRQISRLKERKEYEDELAKAKMDLELQKARKGEGN